MAYGFLRSVFEVFEWYKTPIDMITTSEVAVSLTIDSLTNLDKIVKDLEKFGAVEVDHNLSIVCIVGDFINEKAGFAAEITSALRAIPLRMISYGGSKNNVSVLIRSEHKKEALEVLNNELFNW
jgi:aspartate kinase